VSEVRYSHQEERQ
jgi:hypothetical protein